MKRKKGSSAVTDLRSFLQKSAAKKKQTEPEIVTPSTNAENLIKLAKFYPHDFTFEEMNQLPFQSNRYINEFRNDDNF